MKISAIKAIRLFPFVTAAVVLSACGADPYSIEVTRQEYGESWPLDADKAILECWDGNRIIKVNGGTYALNGKAQRTGFQPLTSILKEDKPYPSSFVEKAGTLCDR